MGGSRATSRLEQLLQPLPPGAQESEAPFDSRRSLRQLLGVAPGELLRTDQIAKDYAFPSPEAVRQYLRRHEVPFLTRGRIVLVDRRDFERSMTVARKARLQKTS